MFNLENFAQAPLPVEHEAKRFYRQPWVFFHQLRAENGNCR